LAQRFFQKHGVESEIVDAGHLRYERGQLLIEDWPIDLVYNRLVDFSLGLGEHQALRAAYLEDAVVVSPNPHVHALFADKRNMTLISDQAALRSWGLPPEMLVELSRVPRTVLVTATNTQDLWEARKKLFFKPAAGYGSKAVYRGDKLTKGVWAEITEGGYVAQEFAAPGERMVKIDSSPQARKTDVRLYVYNGHILLIAARLYQGKKFQNSRRRICTRIRNLADNIPIDVISFDPHQCEPAKETESGSCIVAREFTGRNDE
jgi:hypothetical protein